MMINHIISILVVLCLLSFTAVTTSDDLNKLYSKDYDGFWEHWERIKNEAVSCDDPQKTSLYFSNALETLGNAEVSEANGEVIENLALKNPECLLRGLEGKPIENQRKFIKFFLIHPIFNEPSLIEKSLNQIWSKQICLNLKKVYYSVKRAN
ncbi:MAG: hypothetical protein JRI53_08775 [Deltaproteobacteria bacterium]|nr:hypothetical protein [Deltaproteobacteria bacterium]